MTAIYVFDKKLRKSAYRNVSIFYNGNTNVFLRKRKIKRLIDEVLIFYKSNKVPVFFNPKYVGDRGLRYSPYGDSRPTDFHMLLATGRITYRLEDLFSNLENTIEKNNDIRNVESTLYEMGIIPFHIVIVRNSNGSFGYTIMGHISMLPVLISRSIPITSRYTLTVSGKDKIDIELDEDKLHPIALFGRKITVRDLLIVMNMPLAMPVSHIINNIKNNSRTLKHIRFSLFLKNIERLEYKMLMYGFDQIKIAGPTLTRLYVPLPGMYDVIQYVAKNM